MKFSEIVGQEVAVNILKKSIENNRSHHAYLFMGPDGVGKRTTAIAFAKGLNCRSSSSDGCDLCDSCKKIENRTHPDVELIGPREGGLTISIDQIRKLQRRVAYKPVEGNWKVYIIDDAASHLLKTLEEPPPQVILILITENIYRLLSTVRSRCQLILFRQIPRTLIEKTLTDQYEVAPEEARSLARLSSGSIGRALYCLEKETPEFGERLREIFETGGSLIGGYGNLFQFSAEIPRDRESTLELLNFLLGDLGRKFVENPSILKQKKIEIVMETLDLIKRNVNVNLAIDGMLLKLLDIVNA
ncbi:MAG: DNA polymerase III subunit delta' [Firmicutes bacterium]|nr:DNA polymerase III subunit delta' [Bacillota bacterium]